MMPGIIQGAVAYRRSLFQTLMDHRASVSGQRALHVRHIH
jgi:hypothetical protein